MAVFVGSALLFTGAQGSPDYTFSTLAGVVGTSGTNDGTGAAALFNLPGGVAVDSTGTVYVADSANHTIRCVTPAGAVTTLAGSAGLSGTNDAAGAAARFSFPQGLALDGNGNLLVADTGNNTIRRITPAGAVSTVAGTAGVAGTNDGPVLAAKFFHPSAVTVDGAGNIYVADTGNYTIRKITPAGDVSTLAGQAGAHGRTDGQGSLARFYSPSGLVADSVGHVWVADTDNSVIRLIDLDGNVSTFAGAAEPGKLDGHGVAASFSQPYGLARDAAGNLYVADKGNSTIRRISPAADVTTPPGVTNIVGGVAAQAVAVDAAGNVFLADYGNQVLRQGLLTDGALLVVKVNVAMAGSVGGNGLYPLGSNVQITATASNAWVFSVWNDSVTNNPRTVTVSSGGATYTANFSPLGTVTVLANPPNGGRVAGGGQYLMGSNAMITATASNTWQFMNWNGSITNNPWTFMVVSESMLRTANFARVSTVAVLASPANGGSVLGAGTYLVGSNVVLTAMASNNWLFSKWNDNSVVNPRTVAVPSNNITYTAMFIAPVTVTVKASPAAAGSVSGGGIFQSGSNVTLSATAGSGWRFTAWNDGNTNASRAFTVPAANVICTASFAMGIGAAVDATNLAWTTGGSADWTVQGTTTHDGVAALKSGAIGTGQQTWFQATTNGPGSLMFWWKASTAAANTLQFYINTQLVSQISGNAGWNQYVGFIGTSNQVTLKWVYSKSGAAGASSDAGWVDQINWMPCPYAEHVPLIFYQDPTGLLASWVIGTNASFQFARILANTGGWALKCVGDVDGDTVSDLLFQNAAGDAAGWFMNADGSTRSARYWFNLSGWDIKACGDYEGIGRGQLFFQNAAGVAAYWRIDTNGNYQAAIPLGSMGAWKLRGVGDLDGDHKAELFWQNAAGTVVIWYHNPDGSIRGGVPFNTGNWALCGVADIDGDGVSDLVWQNSAGLTGGWFMNSNGTARAASYWWGTGAWKLKAAGR